MFKLLKFLLNVVIYIAVVVGLVWGLPIALSKLLKTPYPMASITSGSMWPVLKTGDLILIQGAKKEDIRIGDVVVWKNVNGFTIHRVVQLTDKILVTKGDGNFKEDEPVKYEDVVGKAVSVNGKYVRIPYLGFVTIATSKYAVQKND